MFALSQCGEATADAAHEDILIAVLIGENTGSGDTLDIRQARLIRILIQVPDDFPETDEIVIVQERGAVSAVFSNQFFKGIPRNIFLKKDSERATGESNFPDSAAALDIVPYMEFVVIGIGETCVESFLCHFICVSHFNTLPFEIDAKKRTSQHREVRLKAKL